MSLPTDSAGQPWEGRRFETNPHPTDDGSAPAEFLHIIGLFGEGECGQSDVVNVVRDTRFLIPLVAHAGDTGLTEEGLVVDKSQELSIVTVDGPDGRTVLPVFTSVTAMSRWNPLARPVPSTGVRVALAAASEKTDLVVIDPLSETEFALRRPAVWAVAQSLPWVPSFEDAEVIGAFQESIHTERGVISLELSAGDPSARLMAPEVHVTLELVNGLTRSELDAILRRLAERWAHNDVIATRVDSLAVKIVASAA